MPGSTYIKIADYAFEQYGYITQADAKKLGLAPETLKKMAKRGTLERCDTGLYRIPSLNGTMFDAYMKATLWPIGVRGIISHETALMLYNLSDINPRKVHITVPKHYRIRRKIPEVYSIHNTDLAAEKITKFEGIPITTAEQAIRDCYKAHASPVLMKQAINDAFRTGYITRKIKDDLHQEFNTVIIADEAKQ